MADVPMEAVIETNAIFRRDSVTPLMAGRLPSAVHSLVIRQVKNQETILKAAINKDKELAFEAFVNDPLINIPLKDAICLFEEMLQNTKVYLPAGAFRLCSSFLLKNADTALQRRRKLEHN